MVNEAMTPWEFADKYLYYEDEINTLDDLFDYMENHPDDDHWYYEDEIDIADYYEDHDENDGELIPVADPRFPHRVVWFEEGATSL